MSERTVLAEQYLKHIHGTPREDYIKQIVKSDESTDLKYFLGAEQMTLKAMTQLTELKAPPNIMLVWSQILAYISYEIERLTAFKGSE